MITGCDLACIVSCGLCTGCVELWGSSCVVAVRIDFAHVLLMVILLFGLWLFGTWT